MYVYIFTLNDITIPMGRNDSGGATSGHSSDQIWSIWAAL